MSDNNEQLTGLPFVQYMMSRFGKNAHGAIKEALEHNQLTSQQRQHRMNIRNAYLVEDIPTLEAGKEQQDEFGKLCLQEMIDVCEEQGVTNHGNTVA